MNEGPHIPRQRVGNQRPLPRVNVSKAPQRSTREGLNEAAFVVIGILGSLAVGAMAAILVAAIFFLFTGTTD